MIDAALSYAEQGFKVFPLHTPTLGGCSCRKASCDSIGKHPRTMNGVLDATSEKSKIDYWWRMWPDANIGLATGADSGFVVVDVDPQHGGTESLKSLLSTHGELAEKVWVKTGGGGWHLFFRHPGFKVKNNQSGKLGNGIDIRGDGGYIVAPPSVHASGESYTWGVDTLDFPELPAWLISLLQQSAPAQTFSNDETDIPDGARNQTLTSLAGAMRRKGMSEESIYAALSVENDNRCKPPLSAKDIQTISHSIARYSPEDPVFVFPDKTPMDGERPDGIYFVNEIADRVRQLYRKGMRGGVSTGLPALDWNYTVKLGQWTIVTGMPSHGKSAVLDTILHNLVELHGWKVAITSIENQPLERHAAQLIAIHEGLPFGEGDVPRMDAAAMERGLAWLNEHFVFILPDEGGCSVAGILDAVAWVDTQGFVTQGVVIDPWNELEHKRPSGMSETEYVSQSLTRLRRFARMKEKHLWLVAHPTKLQKDIKTGNYPVPTLYDISGSAHFRNKADMGLSIWRDVLNEHSPTEVYVQKVRFRECGKVGKVDLYFNAVSGRFDERPPDYSSYVRPEPKLEDMNI